MSDADRETVRRMWQEVAGSLPDQNAWEAAIERWWHPQLLYEEDPKWPGAGAYRGRDEVRAVFEGYAELMGTATAGVPWDHLWGYLCRTRAGQLEYLRAYWDPDEALADAGVSSP